MPADWIPNNGTQIERALRALFIAEGVATAADCFISNDSGTRPTVTTGATEIIALNSNHDVEPTGNEKWLVRITNKYGAALQPGETNAEVNRLALDQRVGKQMLHLMGGATVPNQNSTTATNITTAGRALAVSDPTNNDDMDEFTCLFVRYLGATRGQPDDGSCAWVEVRNFEITACPLNVD
jgi:hypothetical protein